MIHYDSPPRLLEPPWRAPLIREPFAAPSAFTLCLVSQFLNLSPALDVSPIASPDGLGTSPASWTSPSPSPAFPFDPFHPSPSSQEVPLLLQRFSALGSLGSLQMSIPRTPGGRENQGSSGQPRSSRLLALPKGLVSFLIVLTNTRQKNLKGYLFFAQDQEYSSLWCEGMLARRRVLAGIWAVWEVPFFLLHPSPQEDHLCKV